MTVLMVRIDAPPEFNAVLVQELLKKFPVTILEIKEVADERPCEKAQGTHRSR